MKRKDKVFDYLRQLCSNISLEQVKNGFNGFDATYIGDKIGVSRSNTSAELNELVKEGKIIKIAGKPVYYFDKEHAGKIFNMPAGSIESNVDSLESLINSLPSESKKSEEDNSNGEDPFEQMIGCNDSLKIPVNQAKAAIMYPPNGLNTMLIGETGVGKSTFSEIMYKYAIKSETISKNADFIIFNCAEYADNPNLLISQLFGYVRGAFTGADREKEGLIDKANHGILMLDEVHRLPPEGQEMLFTVMDRGLYRRLGETENHRKASILLICATTEHRDSFLLKTFLRRIPMIIKLPELSERSKTERANLVKSFLNNEAKIIGLPLKVHRDVLIAFNIYKCAGNIGQLKADVQLTCAKGFLEYKTENKNFININLTCVPEHVYSELIDIKQRKAEELDMADKLYDTSSIYIDFLGDVVNGPKTKDDYRLGINLYEEINNRFLNYSNLGYSGEEIKAFIVNYVDKYLKNVISKINIENSVQYKNELFKIINPKIYYAVETALMETGGNKIFDKKVFIALTMHISSVLENVKKNGYKKPRNMNLISVEKNPYYQTAAEIHSIIERELETEIPKEEISIICIFLNTISENNKKVIPKVPIIVICHGDSTASSMVNAVNELLQTDNCHAINMPLNESVKNVLSAARNIVKEKDEGKGVLLLVDMGSLVTFSDIITKDTNIPTRSIDMVSTPLVLEAARKSLFPEYSLDDLTNDLKSLTPYIGRDVINNFEDNLGNANEKIIITTCITGEGAAKKIADLLRSSFPFIEKANIKILSMNGEKFKKIKNQISNNNVIAVIGTTDIHIENVPYIPIDEFIVGDGNKILRNLLIGNYTLENMDIEANISLIVSTLSDQLTFLNPAKAYNVLSHVFDNIKNYFNGENYTNAKVRFILHCSFMIERCFRNEPFDYKNCEEFILKNDKIYSDIITAMEFVEKSFRVNIPKDELCYIIEFIKCSEA